VNNHLTQETVAAFIARRLPAAQVVRLFEHIEDCEACGELFREVRDLHVPSPPVSHPALAGVIFDNHLEYENLVALAENMLDGKTRKLVEQHLQSCVRCRESVRSFVEATRNYEPELHNLHAPGTQLKRALVRLFGGNPGPRWKPSYAALLLLTASLIASSAVFWRETRERESAELASTSISKTLNPYFPSANFAAQIPVTNNAEKNRAPLPPSRKESGSDLNASADRSDKIKRAVRSSKSDRKREAASTTNDGEQPYVWDGKDRLREVSNLPPDVRESVTAALRGEMTFAEVPEIDTPGEIITRSASGRDGDVPAPVSQTYPVGIVLLQERPKMFWRGFAGADGYQVTIVDEGYDPVITSPVLSMTEWQPNEPLPRGETLRWQVVPFKSGQRIRTAPNAGASFQVISQEKFRLLMQARKTYPSHLTLAVLYAREGLLEEAECELKALQKQHPRSRTVRTLLSQIRAKKHRASVGLRCRS